MYKLLSLYYVHKLMHSTIIKVLLLSHTYPNISLGNRVDIVYELHTLQVCAEVSWAAVTAITSHCPGTNLYHIRCTSLETFNAGIAPLGSHGMGDGLALILYIQKLSVMETILYSSPLCCLIHHHQLYDSLPSLTWPTNITMQAGEKKIWTQEWEREMERDRL